MELTLKERAGQIFNALINAYGEPIWRNPLPAIDELVSTILSQNTNDINRDKAFNALRQKYPDWMDVISAPTQEVIELIRVAGLANQKAPRIQQVLSQIFEERGNLDLNFLADMKPADAKAWLTRFHGVGPKTAAIVLCFALGLPAFPVDTHIYRVSGRLGLRPANMSVEDAHDHLEAIFEPEMYYAGHLNIIRLGREICQARKPLCQKCPLIDLCDMGKQYLQISR